LNGQNAKSVYSSNIAWKSVSFPCKTHLSTLFLSAYIPCIDADNLYRQLEALQYKLALTRIDALLTELKRLDDKMILTEVHLLESRVYRGIGNLVKAKVIPFGAFQKLDRVP